MKSMRIFWSTFQHEFLTRYMRKFSYSNWCDEIIITKKLWSKTFQIRIAEPTFGKKVLQAFFSFYIYIICWIHQVCLKILFKGATTSLWIIKEESMASLSVSLDVRFLNLERTIFSNDVNNCWRILYNLEYCMV